MNGREEEINAAQPENHQAGSRRLTGRITDPDGQPVAGVRLIVSQERPQISVSDRDGVYVMDALDPGDVRITLSKDGYQALRESVVADRKEASFVLEPVVRAR